MSNSSGGGAYWVTGFTKECRICGGSFQPGNYWRHSETASHQRRLKRPTDPDVRAERTSRAK